MPLSESSSSTSLSLIARVRQHQPEAWTRFAQLYGPLVYRWVQRADLQHADALDVVQEVFRGVAASIDRYDPDQGSGFRGWLWGIARHKLQDFYRELAAEPAATGGSDHLRKLDHIADGFLEKDDEPEPELSERILLHRALELIRSDVESQTWQAFWRLAVDGQPVAEIGRDLGMSHKAVRQAKYRVLRRLRLELDGQFDWLASKPD